MSEPCLRETVQYSLDTDGTLARYDFAYKDPASGWFTQICIDVLAPSDDTAVLDEQIVPVARAAIVRRLKQKCGVKRAIENQLYLELPRGAVCCRYV